MTDAPTLVRLSAPLCLVSEVQRSGGSMLSQLFDGHPQVFAHPFEIQIGHPKKWYWPRLALDGDPAQWFELLFETPLERFVAEKGYTKAKSNPHTIADRRPFNFDIPRQREVFLTLVARTPPRSQRAVLDAYFSSFFSAWEDWHPTGRERLITGFTPNVVAVPDSFSRLVADYPDGKMISIVRDPRSWWVSARNHHEGYRDRDAALHLWVTSARATLDRAAEAPDRVLPLTYERIAREPEDTMRRIARFVGIDWDPILVMPTFLGAPVSPNSSFAVAAFGIGTHGIDRTSEVAPDDRAAIDRRAMPIYAAADAMVAARLAQL